MIVDDEYLIREGLRNYIDWASLDVQVMLCCSNGIEAMEAMKNQIPDVVLCDISMPYMDGIELLKQCRKLKMNCEFIFISSYAEFRYAQEAVKYGAFDYILKPIEPDVLFSCMQRCVETITERQKYRLLPESNREMLEDWLHGALTGSIQAEKSLIRFLTRKKYSREQLYILCMIRPCECSLNTNIIIYKCNVSENIQAIMCLSTSDKNLLLREIPYVVSCQNIGSLQDSLSEGLFRQWKQNYPLNTSVDIDEKGLPNKNVVLSLNRESMRMTLRNHLRNTVAIIPFFELSKRVEQYLTILYRQLESYYHSPLPNVRSLSCYQMDLRTCNNLYDLFITCERIVDSIYASLSDHPAYTIYTKKTIKIIQNRYGENLMLNKIADELNVSPSYLSTLFKNDTGYSFSDYLYHYRMNLAAGFLIKSRKKIYEIGEQVGYPDVVQFSKRFKQFYDISPRQMRNNL